uniref:C2 NT-type domain-containing protein n=1 Tax=Salix viminalis TaxID=40686 RepID=A0A6N2MS76_SALVM
MVPGKNRRNSSVQVDYLVQIEDIKPWPPSQSLRSLRSVLIQWENGYRNSGSTNTVAPSLGTVVGEGKMSSMSLLDYLEVPVKGKDTDTFQKNCLEFNLYEPRRDKAQLLATAVVDLADYVSGALGARLSLFCTLKSSQLIRAALSPHPVSMDKNGGESVSALMNEEYAEEAEVASFTDDESPPSSLTNGGLPPQNEEIESGRMTESKHAVKNDPTAASQIEMEKHTTPQEKLERSSSYSSSIDLSSDAGSPVNDHASVMNSAISSPLSILKDDVAQSVLSSSPPSTYKSKEEEVNTSKRSNGHQDLLQEVHGKLTNSIATIRRCDIFQNNNENISDPTLVQSLALQPLVIFKMGMSKSNSQKMNQSIIFHMMLEMMSHWE